MLNQIWAITIKEIKVLLHDRGALMALFLLPIAFILVMTVALEGVFEAGSSSNPVEMLVINEDQGETAAKVIADLRTVDGLHLIEQLDDRPVTRAAAEEKIIAGEYGLAVVFPANFSKQIQAAATDPGAAAARVSFVSDPTVGTQLIAPARGMVQGYVERQASLAQAPQLTALGFKEMAAHAPAEQSSFILNVGDRFSTEFVSAEQMQSSNLGVAFETVSPAGLHIQHMPTSTEQNVPAYTIYGVFFIMQTIATGLHREKTDGTFRRLQAAPLSRFALLAGKLLPYYLINLVQIALMFTVGVAVFHMSLGNDPLALVLISLVTSAAATGMGLLLAAVGRTPEQVSSLGTLLSVVLAAVGGMMVPVFVMPDFMQQVALITPHAWALSGFQDVIVRG
ncbi:MAG: ABC transporter permease, partial [Chloroflexi bacterium]|nr:ABC transporter permease [Chloroflexota bacterium]